ncbi:Nucleoporin Nup43 [Glycine soja]|uniref:Nucleoporin Nup43 n=1 Tax=Glycine soja TaxID=3848 RepID=A0A0B2R9R1_GLYSO|nr:Nucleoporin Nup43 [Glycine soja]
MNSTKASMKPNPNSPMAPRARIDLETFSGKEGHLKREGQPRNLWQWQLRRRQYRGSPNTDTSTQFAGFLYNPHSTDSQFWLSSTSIPMLPPSKSTLSTKTPSPWSPTLPGPLLPAFPPSSLLTSFQSPSSSSTSSGSLHFLFSDSSDASLLSEVSLPEGALHSLPASCVDLMDGGVECVSVGEDGKVNLVGIGDSNLNYRRLFDSAGLVSYTAVRWASPMEFATGGFGFGLQWWDQRKPGGPVSQFKGNWDKKLTSGIVHSIDIHPSRKHTCLAGGSLGTVFAWDLRWQQQPIILSGAGAANTAVQSISESEVWEVQYDRCIKSNTSSTRILPSMICSEDGILGVIEQGEEPIELLAEPCAINSFDIDRHNPSDVICSLEWEAVAILTRQ